MKRISCINNNKEKVSPGRNVLFNILFSSIDDCIHAFYLVIYLFIYIYYIYIYIRFSLENFSHFSSGVDIFHCRLILTITPPRGKSHHHLDFVIIHERKVI